MTSAQINANTKPAEAQQTFAAHAHNSHILWPSEAENKVSNTKIEAMHQRESAYARVVANAKNPLIEITSDNARAAAQSMRHIKRVLGAFTLGFKDEKAISEFLSAPFLDPEVQSVTRKMRDGIRPGHPPQNIVFGDIQGNRQADLMISANARVNWSQVYMHRESLRSGAGNAPAPA